MIQHGAREEAAVFKRKREWLYGLRCRATNNIVPYELEAHIKIQEDERHLKIQLFVLFNDHCSIPRKITKPIPTAKVKPYLWSHIATLTAAISWVHAHTRRGLSPSLPIIVKLEPMLINAAL